MSSISSIPGLPEGFDPFLARAPWWGAHLQTLRNTLLRPAPRLRGAAEEMRFSMEDGSGDELTGMLNRPDAPRPGAPLVLLVHGLTGCASSSYMLETAGVLVGQGYPVLRLNLRGAGPMRRSTSRLYHAGRTGDLRSVLASLTSGPMARHGVVTVGYSLGGNMVLKMAGEGTPPGLLAAASVSAPIDLRRSSLRLARRRNFAYHRWLVGAMRAEALAGPLGAGESEVVRSVRSCWEFDDRFVAPRNGWSGAEEYYAANAAKGFLDAVAVPALVVHALDDPWIPGGMYTEHDWSRNPHLVPVLSRRGGHVGFHIAGGGTWHDACLLRFLDRLERG